MSDYFRWVGWQFYLLLFWPSKFAEEVEGQTFFLMEKRSLTVANRFRYMLKVVPWVTLFALLGTLLVGSMAAHTGGVYRWDRSLLGVALGLALGVAGGLTGVAFGVASGVAGGLMGGVFFGVSGGGVANGVAYGIALGVLSGVAYGVVDRVGSFVALGVLLGVSAGVAGGVVYGIAVSFSYYLAYFRLATYPIEVFLAWLAYRKGLAQPEAAFRWWRRCPVFWNQVIYLPLPGVGKLLALATRQNREEGFKQIAFVAAERSLQRRVAVLALTEVALGDLEASATVMISATPDRVAWTNEAPLTLPEDFKKALPRFERAAHQASQFLTVSSAYRKADALKRAIEEVDALQKTLITSRGRIASRLLQIANRWREVLEAEQARLKQLAAEQRETPNPFIFGSPVDERNADVFAGRQDVARQIEESLLGTRQSPSLLLHGPRRMGKSSILRQLPRLLGPDFAPAFLDCQNPAVGGAEASTTSLLRYLTGSISQSLERRRIEVKPLTTETLAREPFAAFDSWLARIEQAMPSTMRALLCLDEYERLQRALEAGWGEEFLDGLRHVIQHRSRFVLLFTGAHTFAELGPAWTDRFISARRVRVSFLEPDDVRPLLTKPIPEFDLTYAPGAVDAVIAATRCQPFLVQAVAFELVQFMNDKHIKEATPADVETAITRALESGGEYFANVWSDAGPEGQAILREIARSAEVVGTGVRRFGSPALDAQRFLTSAPTRVGKWLREHDVLDEAGRFAVPMMERWVRENAG